MSGKKRLLIIDGYNVLRSGSRYKAIAGSDYTDDVFNTARETLINDVASFAGHDGNAFIVFDGAKNQYSHGEVDVIGGVRIMFSPAGQSADKVIEKLARDARERHIKTIVVTSDATIQDTVYGGGVDRMSANDFSREIDSLESDIKRDTAFDIARKNTLADRLDPEVRAKLETLRHTRS